jgi:hypothetical protein
LGGVEAKQKMSAYYWFIDWLDGPASNGWFLFMSASVSLRLYLLERRVRNIQDVTGDIFRAISAMVALKSESGPPH